MSVAEAATTRAATAIARVLLIYMLREHTGSSFVCVGCDGRFWNEWDDKLE